MKRTHLIFVLLTIFLCIGCGASEDASPKISEDSIEDSIQETEKTGAENVVGVFEGLEDKRTAIFSFDGAETAFYFEDQQVQDVLYNAVMGSSYTLSYRYDDSLGYIIYQISE